ncbi:hypothetical protein CRX72_22520 [Pantoea sp. BRM17]|nr:hypothetical protein CRX72_22520 [Pantoea sp. BRM17]
MYNEQLQAGEEIALDDLSQELPPLGEKSFQAFTQEQGYELEEHFPADRSTLRQLTKFSGSGGGLTLNSRYLTFLRGRVGRKVADFFMDFLGASVGLDTKAQNRGLLQAVDDYCAESNLDKNERQNYRQQVYSYCDGGVVLFMHYRYLAVEYLLVAVLNSQSSMRVNEQLDISSTHYLDINHADIVARIDLTEWETSPESRTQAVSSMAEELHRVYSAKSKAYGLFNEDSELADALRNCRRGQDDFLAFSRAATGRLRDELSKYPFDSALLSQAKRSVCVRS